MPHGLVLDFVQRILMFGFQTGSKLLLVGCVIHDLKLLYSNKKHRARKFKYAYGCVRLPSINKEEAIQVLLHNAKGGWLPEFCEPEDKQLDPKERDIVEEVISMSGFGQIYNTEYLPMVVKIMGAELRDYGYLEEWGNDKKVLLTKVCWGKQEAVKELVKQSFDKLPKNLQILFLDVALFILPQSRLP